MKPSRAPVRSPFLRKTAACLLGLAGWLGSAPLSPGVFPETGKTEQRPFAPWTRRREPAETANPAAVPPPGAPAPAQLANAAVPQVPDPSLDEIFKVLASSRQSVIGLNLLFPGNEALGDVEIAEGAAIAEGIALRVGNTPLAVSYINTIIPGKLNVVVGTLDRMQEMLSATEIKGISNGYLALRRLQNRSDTFVLLITGRDSAGVDSAILTLGIAKERLPGASTAAIREVFLPKSPPFLRREPLHSEATYTFTQLQESGAAMVVLPKEILRMELMLPGDFSPEIAGEISLALHFSLRSRVFRTADRVSVKVNDTAAPATGSISPGLNGGSQALAALPLNLFRTGRNMIEISFSGNAMSAGSSEGLQIYADSTLTTPPFTAPPALPNLQVTARTFYPFVGQPDGSEILVYLADHDTETIETAWTLMAKLAQASNTLLYAAEFNSTTPVVTQKHVIAVGSLKNLPADFRSKVPVGTFEEVVAKSAEPFQKKHGITLKTLLLHLKKKARHLFDAPPQETAKPAQAAAPEKTIDKRERAYLGCTPPVTDAHGWLLLLTAPSSHLLKVRTTNLVSPEFWEKLDGESACWNGTLDTMIPRYKATPAAAKELVKADPELYVEMPFGERYNAHLWATMVVFALVIYIIASMNALNRIKKNIELKKPHS